MADAQTPTPAVLAQRMRDACASVRAKSYPLADLIPLMQQAADALAAQAPAQQAVPVATIRTWHKGADQHAELIDWHLVLDALPDGDHVLYTRPAPSHRAVMQQALDALRGYVGAHAIPSSICKERPAYEAAQAAITALSATMEKPHA